LLLLPICNKRTRSESFKLGIWEEREEETTYRAHQSLRQPQPHLGGKKAFTSIHILDRKKSPSLDDCGGRPESRRFYQRNQEADKCGQDDYLDHIAQDGAFGDCSLGEGPSDRFVDPRRRWTWGSRQISRKTKTPVPSNEICRRRSSRCVQIAPAEKNILWTFVSLHPDRSLSAHFSVRFFRVNLRSNIS
jgi:hypothetical protein